MAIICRAHRLLFIQAPRTGCTAIQTVLLDRFGGQFVPPTDILDPDGFIRVQHKHCTIPQLLRHELIPSDYRTHYTSFTTVRNPFDSLVSLYVKKRDKNRAFLSDPNSWVFKVRGYVEDMEFCRTHSFEEWLMKRYSISRLDRLLGKGQRSVYGRYTSGVSVVMRFERLQKDFEQVMRSVGIDGDVTIPSINATPQRKAAYQEYYTTTSRQLIEQVFRSELEQYGYSFNGLDESSAASALMATGR